MLESILKPRERLFPFGELEPDSLVTRPRLPVVPTLKEQPVRDALGIEGAGSPGQVFLDAEWPPRGVGGFGGWDVKGFGVRRTQPLNSELSNPEQESGPEGPLSFDRL
jgi:hypothetical protein